MTEEQKEKCERIIDRHAPVSTRLTGVIDPPDYLGLGRLLGRKREQEQAWTRERAAEMAMELAGVFGGSLTKEEAEALAAAALRKTAGFEAAGWAIARDLEQKFTV